jgi:SAM-dependent methyltransferase
MERFFGPFEAINALDLPGTRTMGLYEGFYAGFYDLLTRNDRYDVSIHVGRARALGSPVLELAAGSGRLAAPLARAGFDVTALDLSQDMLDLLQQKLDHEAPEVRARVQPILGDMTTFELGRTFPMVVLGALSICLLRERADRLALFERVAAHLSPGGRFLFDFLDTTEASLRDQDERIDAVALPTPGRKQFTLVGQRYYPAEHAQVVNFYSEVVNGGSETCRYLASTVKWVVDQRAVTEELAESGLQVYALERIVTVAPGQTIKLVTCGA